MNRDKVVFCTMMMCAYFVCGSMREITRLVHHVCNHDAHAATVVVGMSISLGLILTSSAFAMILKIQDIKFIIILILVDKFLSENNFLPLKFI